MDRKVPRFGPGDKEKYKWPPKGMKDVMKEIPEKKEKKMEIIDDGIFIDEPLAFGEMQEMFKKHKDKLEKSTRTYYLFCFTLGLSLSGLYFGIVLSHMVLLFGSLAVVIVLSLTKYYSMKTCPEDVLLDCFIDFTNRIKEQFGDKAYVEMMLKVKQDE